MEAPFGRFGGTTVPRDYDTGNKKLTGNLNGTLVANVCLFEFYNRPFAGSSHMVRNKLHWDANDAVGLSKQRNSYQSSPTFLCFESPTASFASQCNLFRTMWPDPANGLFLVISRLSFRFFQLTRTIYTLYCLRVIPQGKRARRPIAEVKPNLAGLELGCIWVTDKKYPLLYAIFFCLPSPFLFFFSFFFSFSVVFKN